MRRASWSAASALLVALCTLGNTSVEACDWGCAGCAGYGYGGYGYGGYGYGGYGYGGVGYGGYGYLGAAYAYNPYPAYAYPYYQPAYAYSAPAPYYGYAAPAYGAGGYAPGVYGASYYAPAYGRPYYLGARNNHAPTINGRAPTMVAATHNGRAPAMVAAAHNRRAPAIVAAGQYGMRATAPPTWLSKTPPVTTAATLSPPVKSLAKRPLGFSAIVGQPRPAMKNTEKNTERAIRKIHRPTLTASSMAPGIRRVDAGTARQRVAAEAPNH